MTKKRRYAENTSIEVEKSVAEMRQLLKQAGAIKFSLNESDTSYQLMAEIGGRWYSFSVEQPDPESFRVNPASRWQRRTDAQVEAFATLERQRRWRVLVYLLKAKIIATVEGADDNEKSKAEAAEGFTREMLLYLMLQDGSVVGAHSEMVYEAAQRNGIPDIQRLLLTGK